MYHILWRLVTLTVNYALTICTFCACGVRQEKYEYVWGGIQEKFLSHPPQTFFNGTALKSFQIWDELRINDRMQNHVALMWHSAI